VSTASLEMFTTAVVDPMDVPAHLRSFRVIRAVKKIASNTLVKDRSNKWPPGFDDRHLPGLEVRMGTTAVVEPVELHRAADRSVHLVRLLQIKVCIRKPSVASPSGVLELTAGAIHARRQ